MCVSRRRVHHPVTEQVADHREALTQRESTGRERMPQVMQANPVEAGASADTVPGVVEVDQAGALLLARKNPRAVGGAR